MADPTLNTTNEYTTDFTGVHFVLESLEANSIFLNILSFVSPDSALLPLLQVCRRWRIMVKSYAECALILDNSYLHYSPFNWQGGPVTVEFWLNVKHKHASTLFCASKGRTNEISRFQAHVPWNNGLITWDYGGSIDPYLKSRLTAPFPKDKYGKWNHFAFVSTGVVFPDFGDRPFTAIYVNCQCLASEYHSDSPDSEMTDLTIGRKAMSDISPEFVTGVKIRNLRIWSCVRTLEQIRKYHKENVLPKKVLNKLFLWLPLSSCLNKESLKDRSSKKVVLKSCNNVKWEKENFRNMIIEKLEIPTPKTYLHFNRGTLTFSRMPNWKLVETRPITVDFFIFVNKPHDHVLFTFGTDDNHSRFQAHVPWSNGLVTFDYGGHDLDYISNGRVEADYGDFHSWVHVALVCEGKLGRLSIYLNGLHAITHEPCDIPKEKNFQGPLYVGSDGHKKSFFEGGLWRFRVWERALSADEVKKAATGGEVPKEALRIFFPLDEGSGMPKDEISKEQASMDGDYAWKKESSAK